MDLKKWEEFPISKLFTIVKGERLTVLDRASGEIPLITAKSYNNGIAEFIDYETFKDEKKIFENRISVDMFSNVFYHNYKYFSDDNIHTLSFLDETYNIYYENKYVNLFLITVLGLLSSKYDYGRQVRLKRYEKEFIKLPAKKVKGKYVPDFGFMEKYIKTLPYSSAI